MMRVITDCLEKTGDYVAALAEAKRAAALLEAMDNERFRDVFGKEIAAQIARLSSKTGE